VGRCWLQQAALGIKLPVDANSPPDVSTLPNRGKISKLLAEISAPSGRVVMPERAWLQPQCLEIFS
jgi:hypothetical protein